MSQRRVNYGSTSDSLELEKLEGGGEIGSLSSPTTGNTVAAGRSPIAVKESVRTCKIGVILLLGIIVSGLALYWYALHNARNIPPAPSGTSILQGRRAAGGASGTACCSVMQATGVNDYLKNGCEVCTYETCKAAYHAAKHFGHGAHSMLNQVFYHPSAAQAATMSPAHGMNAAHTVGHHVVAALPHAMNAAQAVGHPVVAALPQATLIPFGQGFVVFSLPICVAVGFFNSDLGRYLTSVGQAVPEARSDVEVVGEEFSAVPEARSDVEVVGEEFSPIYHAEGYYFTLDQTIFLQKESEQRDVLNCIRHLQQTCNSLTHENFLQYQQQPCETENEIRFDEPDTSKFDKDDKSLGLPFSSRVKIEQALQDENCLNSKIIRFSCAQDIGYCSLEQRINSKSVNVIMACSVLSNIVNNCSDAKKENCASSITLREGVYHGCKPSGVGCTDDITTVCTFPRKQKCDNLTFFGAGQTCDEANCALSVLESDGVQPSKHPCRWSKKNGCMPDYDIECVEYQLNNVEYQLPPL